MQDTQKNRWTKLKGSFLESVQMIKTALPIMIGVLLLLNLIKSYTQGHYTALFSGNPLIDPLMGALAGSVYFGSPIISYIVGGELLAEGISLMAITAFVMTWSTVGIAMLPLEAKCLGKKFSIIRNITNFFSSIIVAVLTVYTLNLL
ncbi:MAG: hypothetical protein KOO64_09235 [Desulfobacterales bacterium]|nr:hypothetical protein [Desulfobacterales bacterium]